MQKGGREGVQIACKIACVFHGRPLLSVLVTMCVLQHQIVVLGSAKMTFVCVCKLDLFKEI